jgi:predicted nucleotide-binding protein (sugar kinase/HSP70/actin superfamily)
MQSLYFDKRFGEYIVLLEREISQEGLSNVQKACLHINIARAQRGMHQIFRVFFLFLIFLNMHFKYHYPWNV